MSKRLEDINGNLERIQDAFCEAVDRDLKPKVEALRKSMIQIGVSSAEVMKEISKGLPTKGD